MHNAVSFIFHLGRGVKPITELVIEQFPLHYYKEKRFFLRCHLLQRITLHCFFYTGGSTSKVTSADVSVSLTVVCLFGSCFSVIEFLQGKHNILFVHPECNAAIHKRCIEKIIGKCTGSATNSRDTMVSKVNVQHLCKNLT